MVWPQAFIVNNKLQPVLNKQLLRSAVQTSLNPQTIVYTLNPKAVWSDGTPITADDFIYNWQAQSGNPAYTDVGGKPFDDASTTGYSQITSVVGSNPSGGAPCAAGSTADENAGLCPNGRTVTVTFKPTFTDWRSLFTNIVPAHVARVVGWNTGFSGPSQVVSGSWFKLQSYNANQSVVLVRNPRYWGTPAKLNKLVFEFFSDDGQLVPALQNHEVDIVNPTNVNLSIVQNASQVPNATTATVAGLQFEHLDFNQADPYLAKVQVRQAIAHGVDRRSIIARTVGEIDKSITPLGSRMLVPTQAGYKATSYAYNPSLSERLLRKIGFKKGSDGYFRPNYGPQKGQDLTFTIQSTAGNSIRAETEELFGAQMKKIGIKVNIQNSDVNTLFGTNLPNGAYQITEFAVVHDSLRLGQPADLLLVHRHGQLRRELDPLGQCTRGPAVGRGFDRTEHVSRDQRLQPGRRRVVAEHGDAAAVPDAAALRLVEQPQGCSAEHIQRGRHLERGGLEHHVVAPAVRRLARRRDGSRDGWNS